MLQFEISAALQYSGTTSSSSSEMLTLSPSVPMAVSSSKALLAKLLGDLASYSQLPVLRCVVQSNSPKHSRCSCWSQRPELVCVLTPAFYIHPSGLRLIHH
eukprot:GHRR01037584.1.p2 GENE.GHRR01037584.1~~GHRR01037584.1.p2  ORF type:complete len:101 (+),score=28.87 GHRR01037584.1:694-996(+)